MLLIHILFLSLLLVFPATAQDILTGGSTTSAEESADPGASSAAVDDLIRILQDDTARAALIERLQ